MQARVARACDRSPPSFLLVQKDDVIEVIDRFEAQDERGIAVLLEDDRGKERSLEAMSAAVAYDAAETAQRGTSVRLLVVRQPIEIALDSERRAQRGDQPSFPGRERSGTRTVSSRHQPSRACRRALDPDSIRFPCTSGPDCPDGR